MSTCIEMNHDFARYCKENNGIAKVDIDRAEVLEIYPLGYKIWSETPIDPSDKDGGMYVCLISW